MVGCSHAPEKQTALVENPVDEVRNELSGMKQAAPGKAPRIRKVSSPYPDAVEHFEVSWLGMHVGDVVVEVAREGGYCTIRLYAQAYGVANLATKFKAQGSSKARCSGRQVKPLMFEMSHQLRGKKRVQRLEFNDNGELKTEEVNPPDKDWKRPKVADADKKGAIDPLNVVFLVYQHIDKWQKGGSPALKANVYDGRKLVEFALSIQGEKSSDTYEIQMTNHYLAGVTDREKENRAKGDPVVTMVLDDMLLTPIYGKGVSSEGAASLRHVRQCKDFDDCIKSLKQK